MGRQGPQNVDTEFGGSCHQETHVGWTWRGADGLTEFEHEVFKACWGAEDQHVCWRVSNDTETMNHFARTKYESTFTRKKPSAVDKECDLTGDDVKRLIFFVVDMEVRFKAGGHQGMLG